jgi:FMN reductase
VPAVTAVAVNGSPSTTSKTHALAAAGLELAGGGTLVNVSELDAEALLLRREHDSVKAAVDAIATADVLILVTPVYRATYSGLLKVVLDQLPTDALRGTAAVLAATAGSPAHFLALDTGLRAAVASLAGWSVPTVAYATGDDFDADNHPLDGILTTLGRAVAEAKSVVG